MILLCGELCQRFLHNRITTESQKDCCRNPPHNRITTESQQNHKRIIPRPGPSTAHTKRNKKHLARGAPQQSHGRNTQILLCGITKVLGPTGLDVQKVPNRGMAINIEIGGPGGRRSLLSMCFFLSTFTLQILSHVGTRMEAPRGRSGAPPGEPDLALLGTLKDLDLPLVFLL